MNDGIWFFLGYAFLGSLAAFLPLFGLLNLTLFLWKDKLGRKGEIK